jgi:hypothetical protein
MERIEPTPKMEAVEIYIGGFEGRPIYATIPNDEIAALENEGYKWDEIVEMYQIRDWKQDC